MCRSSTFTIAIGVTLTLTLMACGRESASQRRERPERPPKPATAPATASGGVAATAAARMRAKGTMRIAGTIPWGAPHTARMTARIRLGPAGITASDTIVDVGGGERHREIRIGAVSYEDQPPETMPPGKRWTKYAQLDEADPAPDGLRIGDDSALDPADPEMLRILLAQSGPGRTATLDGITTTQYGGMADLARLVAATRGDQRRTLAGLVSAGIVSITWRMWLDGAGLPRRFTETLTHERTGSPPRRFGPETTTVDYSHWGHDNKIEAPPAEQVVDDDAEPAPPLPPSGLPGPTAL